ncbi:MAG: penicillin-insensitive murein endopeptidase [Myxococcota bacterium]
MRLLVLALVLPSSALAQALLPDSEGQESSSSSWQRTELDGLLPPLGAVGAPLEAETDDDDGTPEGVDGEATEAEAPEAEAALAEGSEVEGACAPGVSDGGFLYSADLSDEELARRFVEDPASLGSISVGLAEAGRVMNAVQLEPGDAWQLVTPESAWGTQEAIDALKLVARRVRDTFPTAPPLRVNHIGKKDGGYLRPHQSHQSGRDVDLGFYYQPGVDLQALKKRREHSIDLGANWALIRALATEVDVQFILVDRRVQKVLYEYALSIGEDKAWLDSLFNAGADSLVRHARRHRDHFHVRFFAPRSQELGRRVQPILAKRPEENLVIHRVKKGDTLGHLAVHYGSTVRLIQKANGLTGTMLRVGRTLNVPLRGPCNNCPLPPPLVVPARKLPPKAPEARVGAFSTHTG